LAAFLAALRAAGYDDMLSIENEDATQPAVDGVEEAAAFMLPLIAAAGGRS
jgi:sugar phosphate isomerase/epimerase